MNLNSYLYLQHPDFEVSINPKQINYVQRIGRVVWVYFIGSHEPLQLRNELAESFWKIVLENSICICLNTASQPNTDKSQD